MIYIRSADELRICAIHPPRELFCVRYCCCCCCCCVGLFWFQKNLGVFFYRLVGIFRCGFVEPNSKPSRPKKKENKKEKRKKKKKRKGKKKKEGKKKKKQIQTITISITYFTISPFSGSWQIALSILLSYHTLQ